MESLLFRREVNQELENEIKGIINLVENMQIPECYPEEMINNFYINRYNLRDKFIKLIGFVLISNDWIKPLSQWISNKKCLEVMAGTGALSYALKQQGVNIITTDNYSWKTEENQGYYWKEKLWTEIENIDAIEAVKKYGKDVDIIIMSWAYMDDTAYEILQTMREINPNCVLIFIGEGHGGCTASDEFFDSIQEIEDKEFKLTVSNFKQWWGVYDYPQLVK